MQLIKEQIETLKEKCPECKGSGTIYVPMGRDFKGACLTCRSTGQAIIEIEKEMIPQLVRVPKYKVGDEIEVVGKWRIKLKIVSETEDKWRLVMVK